LQKISDAKDHGRMLAEPKVSIVDLLIRMTGAEFEYSISTQALTSRRRESQKRMPRPPQSSHKVPGSGVVATALVTSAVKFTSSSMDTPLKSPMKENTSEPSVPYTPGVVPGAIIV